MFRLSEMATEEERYLCEQCEPPADVTELVHAERAQSLEVLRASTASGRWSVWVRCPRGHDNVFEGG